MRQKIKTGIHLFDFRVWKEIFVIKTIKETMKEKLAKLTVVKFLNSSI